MAKNNRTVEALSKENKKQLKGDAIVRRKEC